MKRLVCWVRCAAFVGVLFCLTGTLMAGTTPIHIDIEGSGDVIDEVNGTTNHNGGIFWNGTAWVTNNTAAHAFFTDLRTGERIKKYEPARTRNYAGTGIVNDSYGPYRITGSLYSYDKPAADGSGIFRMTGTKYTITEESSLQTILLSRGLGLGTGTSYFDIYLEMTSGPISNHVTTALLGDPIWYQYSGRAADAIAMDSAGLTRRGSLPGALTKQGTYAGDYFFDINGGSDMGGLSYEIFTSARNPAEALTQNLHSTFVTGFNLKYYNDASEDLHLLSFLPGLVKEEFIPNSTTLYFPHVDTNLPWQTEIAVINTGSQTATGTLRALSNMGQLVGTKAVTLPPHARRQIAVATEFANPTNIGYIVFESDSTALQGYTKFYQAGIYRAAIPAVKEINTGNIYISHIDSSALWWTGVSLVNTTATPKDLTITFNTGQTKQISLTANEHRAFDIAGLFNNQPQPDIKSAVIANASGVIGLELFGSSGGGNQLDGLLLTDTATSTLYYPHVASDAVWWTGIAAYNPSESACTITVTPYSAQGNPLTPSTLPIEGKGKYIGLVSGLGLPTGTAWFKIDSTSPLSGFELFGTADGKQLAAYAGKVGTGAKSGVFAKIEKNGWTGIAFVNTEAGAASVTLTAYNDNGNLVATQVLIVGGHAKVVNYAEAIFAQDISAATYIAYSSDRNVVGFQLNGSSDGMTLDGLPALGGGSGSATP